MDRDALMKVVHQLESKIEENAVTRADAENVAWLLQETIKKKNEKAAMDCMENSRYCS